MKLHAKNDAALKSTYDAVVVVPSYREGIGVLPLLQSVAAQYGANRFDIACIVAVNQAKADTEATVENRKTARILEALWNEEEGPDLVMMGTEEHESQSPDDLVLYHGILDSRLECMMLNMYTERHAPTVCNVGKARDKGGQAGLTIVREDGILVFTDADSELGSKYVRKGLEVMEEDYALQLAKGPIVFRQPENPTEADKLRTSLYFKECKFLERQHEFLSTGKPPPRADYKEHMGVSGCNITIRPALFEKIGFAHVNGGEDGELARQAYNLGHEAKHFSELTAFTPLRISTRTSKECGLGQGIHRLSQVTGSPFTLPVPTLSQQKIRVDVVNILEQEPNQGRRRTLRGTLRKKLEQHLPPELVQAILKGHFSYKPLIQASGNPVVWTLLQSSLHSGEQQPLRDGLVELANEMITAADAYPFTHTYIKTLFKNFHELELTQLQSMPETIKPGKNTDMKEITLQLACIELAQAMLNDMATFSRIAEILASTLTEEVLHPDLRTPAVDILKEDFSTLGPLRLRVSLLCIAVERMSAYSLLTTSTSPTLALWLLALRKDLTRSMSLLKKLQKRLPDIRYTDVIGGYALRHRDYSATAEQWGVLNEFYGWYVNELENISEVIQAIDKEYGSIKITTKTDSHSE